MPKEIIRLQSISQLHSHIGIDKPKNQDISIVDASKLQVTKADVNSKIIYDFYTIYLKDKSCGADYGRNSFDFDEGVMVFSAPGQVYSPKKTLNRGDIQGWMLLFHPDLIRNTKLSSQINEYSFFNYEVYEALHLSENEEQVIIKNISNIQKECNQNIDNESLQVIISNLELLFGHISVFYQRQFNTRTSQSRDVLSRFEKDLKEYFKANQQIEFGLPNIQYFADNVYLSQHYFSDLLKKETGRAAKEHINDFVVEKAKNMILETDQSISDIAYSLGFNYPHYFIRLFKSKTGVTPIEFRNLN